MNWNSVLSGLRQSNQDSDYAKQNNRQQFWKLHRVHHVQARQSPISNVHFKRDPKESHLEKKHTETTAVQQLQQKQQQQQQLMFN